MDHAPVHPGREIMSNHPYGLRGDPFSSPATLSPKDASRLIRRRVRAFNGDGGALFPIDTCDLIHELAGGIPDAMLQLAGKAMHIAAAEGSPAVLTDHVRKAAEAAPHEAGVAPAAPAVASTPEARGTERAARALDALIEAAEDAVRGRTTTPSEAGTPIEDRPPQPATRSSAEADAEEETAMAAIDFDDPDLPPFQPATFALPTQPSENLDPDARDWVSRFIPPAGAAPVAGEASRVARAPIHHEVTPTSAPPRASGGAPALAPAFAALRPRRASRPHGPRRRRRSGSQGLLIAVAALCVVAFIVRMSLRGSLVPPTAGPAPPSPTSAPAVDRPADVPDAATTSRAPVVRDPAPANPPASRDPVRQEPVTILRPPATETAQPLRAPAPGAAPGPVEPARRSATSGRFGLEVATFIFEERARVERDRLADAGLHARIITTLEYGSRVYRVVLGGYPDPAAAERAADSLLSNGVVLQARVIRVP